MVKKLLEVIIKEVLYKEFVIFLILLIARSTT